MNASIIARNMTQTLSYYTVTDPVDGYGTPSLSSVKTLNAYIVERRRVIKERNGTEIITMAEIFLPASAISYITHKDLILFQDDKIEIKQFTPFYRGNILDYIYIII